VWFFYRPGKPNPQQAARRVQDLAARAVQLEEAAERFKLAGDAKRAASFAEQAAELRRAGV
jgi:hypothetical protein